jgi:hypothetical protein
MIITRATSANLPAIWDVLGQAAARLRARGRPPWPNEITAKRLPLAVERGDMYLAWDDRTLAGTVTVAADGDRDFWSPRELAEPASYMSTGARADGYEGLGAALNCWVVAAAAARGDRWVRLDVGRDNPGLQAYYARQGWQHVRTVPAPGRKSGALFARIALAVPHPFAAAPRLPARKRVASAADALGVLPPGTLVTFEDWRRGTVNGVIDLDQGEFDIGGHEMTTRAPVAYRVQLAGGGEVTALEGEVTETALVRSTTAAAA